MSFEQFRKMAHEFFTLAKTMNKSEQISAGFKALGIAYLHLKCTEDERWQAASIMRMASIKEDQAINASPRNNFNRI